MADLVTCFECEEDVIPIQRRATESVRINGVWVHGCVATWSVCPVCGGDWIEIGVDEDPVANAKRMGY